MGAVRHLSCDHIAPRVAVLGERGDPGAECGKINSPNELVVFGDPVHKACTQYHSAQDQCRTVVIGGVAARVLGYLRLSLWLWARLASVIVWRRHNVGRGGLWHGGRLIGRARVTLANHWLSDRRRHWYSVVITGRGIAILGHLGVSRRMRRSNAGACNAHDACNANSSCLKRRKGS